MRGNLTDYVRVIRDNPVTSHTRAVIGEGLARRSLRRHRTVDDFVRPLLQVLERQHDVFRCRLIVIDVHRGAARRNLHIHRAQLWGVASNLRHLIGIDAPYGQVCLGDVVTNDGTSGPIQMDEPDVRLLGLRLRLWSRLNGRRSWGRGRFVRSRLGWLRCGGGCRSRSRRGRYRHSLRLEEFKPLVINVKPDLYRRGSALVLKDKCQSLATLLGCSQLSARQRRFTHPTILPVLGAGQALNADQVHLVKQHDHSCRQELGLFRDEQRLPVRALLKEEIQTDTLVFYVAGAAERIALVVPLEGGRQPVTVVGHSGRELIQPLDHHIQHHRIGDDGLIDNLAHLTQVIIGQGAGFCLADILGRQWEANGASKCLLTQSLDGRQALFRPGGQRGVIE